MEVWTGQSKQAARRQSGADSYQVGGGRDVKGGADVGNGRKQVSCLWQIGGMCYQSPHVFTVCVCVCVFSNSSLILKKQLFLRGQTCARTVAERFSSSVIQRGAHKDHDFIVTQGRKVCVAATHLTHTGMLRMFWKLESLTSDTSSFSNATHEVEATRFIWY